MSAAPVDLRESLVTDDRADVASPRPATPPTKRGRATRADLLAAARKVFSEADYDEAKITDITSTAGVATGSFYSYFASKEEIFREVAGEVIDELVAAAHRGPDDTSEDIAASIEAALRRYVAVAARHATLTSSLQRISHVDPELRAYRTEGMARTVAGTERTIRTLQGSGVADPTVDAAVLAQVLQSMVISAVYDRLAQADGGLDQEELVAALSHVWLQALGLHR